MSYSSQRNKKLSYFTVETLQILLMIQHLVSMIFSSVHAVVENPEKKHKIENVDHDLCRNQFYKSSTYAC